MIAIDSNKQQVLNAVFKAIQQNNFTGSLDREATMFFIIEEVKKTILDLSQETVRVLQIFFALILYQYKTTHCNTSNVKLSNSQLSKSKSGIEMYWSNFKSFMQCNWWF